MSIICVEYVVWDMLVFRILYRLGICRLRIRRISEVCIYVEFTESECLFMS